VTYCNYCKVENSTTGIVSISYEGGKDYLMGKYCFECAKIQMSKQTNIEEKFIRCLYKDLSFDKHFNIANNYGFVKLKKKKQDKIKDRLDKEKELELNGFVNKFEFYSDKKFYKYYYGCRNIKNFLFYRICKEGNRCYRKSKKHINLYHQPTAKKYFIN
jgi:hypothetical protein